MKELYSGKARDEAVKSATSRENLTPVLMAELSRDGGDTFEHAGHHRRHCWAVSFYGCSRSSEAVVCTQTLTVGGSVVTLAGNQVASLGSSGLVVLAPGGFVTTIPAQPESTTYTTLPALTLAVIPESTISGAVQVPSLRITSVMSPSIVSSTSSASSTTTGLGALILQTSRARE